MMMMMIGTVVGQSAIASGKIYPPPLSEMSALQNLYDTCGGNTWNWNSSYGLPWNFDKLKGKDEYISNPCLPEWQGIGCNCVANNQTNPIYSYYSYDDAFEPLSLNNVTSANCTILKVDLRGMGLVGTIPTTLSSLTNLAALHLSYNNLLRGAIPSQLWEMASLQQLYLSHTSLQGTLSSDVSRLSNLLQLAISATLLSKAVPDSLFTMSQLEELYLGQNQRMAGDISNSLSRLSRLRVLVMTDAGGLLGSSFPTSILGLSELVRLSLASNGLTGSIPIDIGTSLLNLEYLNLKENKFRGA